MGLIFRTLRIIPVAAMSALFVLAMLNVQAARTGSESQSKILRIGETQPAPSFLEETFTEMNNIWITLIEHMLPDHFTVTAQPHNPPELSSLDKLKLRNRPLATPNY